MARRFSVQHQPGFTVIAVTCFLLLYFPILVLIVYAFNAATSTSVWGGLSLQWFEAAWNNSQVIEAR